jgi:tetratricopeptide (TPR) repeat protein
MEDNVFVENRLTFISRMDDLLKNSTLADALKLAHERLASRPYDVDALFFIHRILLEMGRIEEARNFLLELEKYISGLASVYLRCADTYKEKGLNADAVLYYQKYLCLNSLAHDAGGVAEKIALLEREENTAAAGDESGDVALPGPEYYTITLAELYIRQGHLKTATNILEEIIARDPDNIQARAKLDTVRAAVAHKLPAGESIPSTTDLVETLSRWLENIGRLKKNAQ